MKNKLPILILALGAIIGGYVYLSQSGKQAFDFSNSSQKNSSPLANEALAAKFDTLRKNGNSSCSASFQQAVSSGSTGKDRLQGSCCSPMDPHRYSEQVEGLKKYSNIPEIPPDPYDIDAELAQKMTNFYNTELTPEEQKAYDYAMANSNEKGPCCCKCWRWYVYGGLGKYLIKNYQFTGEQITEIWNLSDGCGGPGDHVNHS